ncbi:response regulator transcription factor [Aliikangiella sp. G2MR2-5]|uniref:response regulator transcription factor n=1 Tax=Aliikangiella sp. G2MR2-5 TaxID=2788943 RepID=UPI0018A9874C|nr:response regulator transcription factor [Aliikangiella sp. G2MR2-5]
MSAKILIVEDDDNLRETLADNLELEGYRVFSHALVKDAQQFLANNSVDIVVLDIMLPDGNGYDLCRWIRSQTDVLILMLTARNLEKDVVEGFISGTDDYVSKPYRSSELILRIKALLRRKSISVASESQDFNGYQVNWNLREVYKDGIKVHLTKTAFEILLYLFEHLNKPCSREEILNSVWGNEVYIDNRTVDNFVSNLKKQLELIEGANFQIKTIRGVGYSLIKS